MNNNTKQYAIVGVVVVVLIAVAAYILSGQGSKKEQANDKKTVFDKPSSAIPTVDSSVDVQIKGNKEAVMTVKGVPDGTEKIEYELSYNTKNGSMEGVLGGIDIKNGEQIAETDFIFGTSSSGVNRYHEIVGKVKGTFKFSGEYGQRLLEKEFSL
ncbi:hypothetical protein BH09PAT2_BH09PAT2_00620 [soil metagenome]